MRRAVVRDTATDRWVAGAGDGLDGGGWPRWGGGGGSKSGRAGRARQAGWAAQRGGGGGQVAAPGGAAKALTRVAQGAAGSRLHLLDLCAALPAGTAHTRARGGPTSLRRRGESGAATARRRHIAGRRRGRVGAGFGSLCAGRHRAAAVARLFPLRLAGRLRAGGLGGGLRLLRGRAHAVAGSAAALAQLEGLQHGVPHRQRRTHIVVSAERREGDTHAAGDQAGVFVDEGGGGRSGAAHSSQGPHLCASSAFSRRSWHT
jgi:hypothetical protein